MTWEWAPTAEGGWIATGDWVWELLPYQSKIQPDLADGWIIRARRADRKDWRYFGAYRGLQNAQSSAQRMDERPVGHPLYAKRYTNECPEDRWGD